MANLIIKTEKILSNIYKLHEYISNRSGEWTLIMKLLSGHTDTLERLLADPIIKDIHSVGDSRLSNLQRIKEINPEVRTMYIKPPPMQYAEEVVSCADISHNTSLRTIKALNREAKKQNKIHKVIIMLELGELREGVMRENLSDFYEKLFTLSNIEVIGIGSNLGCMFGVEPSYDKLVQLNLYKELLEAKFNKKIPLVSGGSSITLPYLGKKNIAESINHHRIGEAVFLGTSPYNNKKFRNLSTDAFEYHTFILELEKKEDQPDGVISDASVGHTTDESDEQSKEDYLNQETPKNYKAILDFGVLDVDVNEIEPKNKKIKFIGTTSDMSVYDIGPNLLTPNKRMYRVGSKVAFKPTYIGVARLMNSKFVEKVVV